MKQLHPILHNLASCSASPFKHNPSLSADMKKLSFTNQQSKQLNTHRHSSKKQHQQVNYNDGYRLYSLMKCQRCMLLMQLRYQVAKCLRCQWSHEIGFVERERSRPKKLIQPSRATTWQCHDKYMCTMTFLYGSAFQGSRELLLHLTISSFFSSVILWKAGTG